MSYKGGRRRIDATAAVQEVINGVHPTVAAERHGVSVATIWRRRKEAAAPKLRQGRKTWEENLETFRKDVADLLVDELRDFDILAVSTSHLADLITDLAAASLRRNRR